MDYSHGAGVASESLELKELWVPAAAATPRIQYYEHTNKTTRQKEIFLHQNYATY